MRIPLFNRLRKQFHREIAMLQDEVVEIVYALSPDAVLHGGTTVWRCYSGNRFSEDLDFYLVPKEKFREQLKKTLESRGLFLLKYKKTKSTIFSKISNGTVEIRLEVAIRNIREFEPRPFERTDGSFIDVFTPSPEQLLLEKMEAYSNRKLIRDFYDIYTLSAIVSLDKKLSEKTLGFLEKAKKPLDEKNLKTIVFSGAIPSFEQMELAVKRRF